MSVSVKWIKGWMHSLRECGEFSTVERRTFQIGNIISQVLRQESSATCLKLGVGIVEDEKLHWDGRRRKQGVDSS